MTGTATLNHALLHLCPGCVARRGEKGYGFHFYLWMYLGILRHQTDDNNFALEKIWNLDVSEVRAVEILISSEISEIMQLFFPFSFFVILLQSWFSLRIWAFFLFSHQSLSNLHDNEYFISQFIYEVNLCLAAETVLLAFQNYILVLGTSVMIPSLLVPAMGGNDVSFCQIST